MLRSGAAVTAGAATTARTQGGDRRRLETQRKGPDWLDSALGGEFPAVTAACVCSTVTRKLAGGHPLLHHKGSCCCDGALLGTCLLSCFLLP